MLLLIIYSSNTTTVQYINSNRINCNSIQSSDTFSYEIYIPIFQLKKPKYLLLFKNILHNWTEETYFLVSKNNKKVSYIELSVLQC